MRTGSAAGDGVSGLDAVLSATYDVVGAEAAATIGSEAAARAAGSAVGSTLELGVTTIEAVGATAAGAGASASPSPAPEGVVEVPEVSVVVALVLIAVAALGKENVRGVSLPSQFSSQGSLDDARILAANLGIQYDVIPIQPMFLTAKEQLKNVFAGRTEDVAEENIQARLRGVILMAMSNKFGSLLLTTGNKSEIAVGYCTLYGDMCGGLSVINDVPKMMVYRLSNWINREREIIPAASITKPPSAELRPGQTDQDSLPPYEVLDAILDAYVVEGCSVDEIIQSGFDAPTVRRVVRLIEMSEYKRRQAAPGLKVTTKAFGIGRRVPVAQRYREY